MYHRALPGGWVVSILVFVCAMVSGALAQDFRSSNWGDTVEQVSAAESESVSLPVEADVVANGVTLHALSYSVQLADQPFRLDMEFCDGRLCQAKYTNAFDITDNNYALCATLYNGLKTKYGSPVGVRLNPGMTAGKLLMGTSAAGSAGGYGDGLGNWKTNTTRITFVSNYSATISSKRILITYTDNAYVGVLNSAARAIAKGQAQGGVVAAGL